MDTQSRPTTRREFLVGIASVVVLVVARPTVATAGRAQTGPVTLGEFMELSEVLTDKVANLRDEVGAQYFAALDQAALRRLVQATIRLDRPPKTFDEVLRSGALSDPQNAATAQQILTFWYTGLVGNRTADYLEALAWATLGGRSGAFAVPASTPLGFSKWDERP